MAFVGRSGAQLVSVGFLGGNVKPMSLLHFGAATRTKIYWSPKGDDWIPIWIRVISIRWPRVLLCLQKVSIQPYMSCTCKVDSQRPVPFSRARSHSLCGKINLHRGILAMVNCCYIWAKTKYSSAPNPSLVFLLSVAFYFHCHHATQE
jgi:hypothetical protein